MNLANLVLAIASLVLVGGLSTVLGIMQYRRNRDKDTKAETQAKADVSDAHIRQLMEDAFNSDAFKRALTLGLIPLSDSVHAVQERLHVVETQVAPLTEEMWLRVRRETAKGIHSPDPRRWRVDELMEKLINDEPLTASELVETREILETIINYEAGQSPDPGFPIKDGEQSLAIWLLMSLDFAPVQIVGESS